MIHPIEASKQRKIDYDKDNASWLLPLRHAFHAWLESQGYAPQTTPAPGATYPGSHAQGLWECWLASTLAERERCKEAVWQAQVNASGEDA